MNNSSNGKFYNCFPSEPSKRHGFVTVSEIDGYNMRWCMDMILLPSQFLFSDSSDSNAPLYPRLCARASTSDHGSRHDLWICHRHVGTVHRFHLLCDTPSLDTHSPSLTSNTNQPHNRAHPRYRVALGRPMPRSSSHSQRHRGHRRCQALQHPHPILLSCLHGHYSRHHRYTPSCSLLGQ